LLYYFKFASVPKVRFRSVPYGFARYQVKVRE
jgi:hypothetical protein